MQSYLRATISAFTILISASAVGRAQQYMKPLTVTDDKVFDGYKLTKCRAVAPAAYPSAPDALFQGVTAPKPSGVCFWEVDRAAEMSPPPLSLHARTRIVVRIRNPRPDESIAATVVYGKFSPPSPGNDVLKNAVNPIQTIAPSPQVRDKMATLVPTADMCLAANVNTPEDAQKCQAYLTGQVNSMLISINHVNAALACFENYQVTREPAQPSVPDLIAPKYVCADRMDPAAAAGDEKNFVYQKTKVIQAEIEAAMNMSPPVAIYKIFDNAISARGVPYASEIAEDAQISAGISAIQSGQAALQQVDFALAQIPNTPTLPSVYYYYDVPSLTTATATVTGTEVISKTASTMATWAATSNSYNIVFSAGLGFSTLVNRSYANTPQVSNGKPVLDGNGNVVSMVTETDTRLTVLAPEVLGSYLLPLPRKLYAACSFGCSLLVSGGLGANLTSKTADFDTGISLRLADLLLTPTVHFGREQRLINGITVGEQIGPNAPSSLATQGKWVRKFGFVITYVIPLT